MEHPCDTLLVRDSLAVQAARVHELAPGKRFTLKADEDTEVPYALANRLVGIDGFLVQMRTPDGNVIPLCHQKADDAGGGQATIRADQVIADLTELTAEALARRCNQAVPDAKYHARSSRGEMVNALMTAAVERSRAMKMPAAIDLTVDEAPYQRAS